MDEEQQKWCPSCQSWKPQTAFSRDRATKDGLRGRCKECDKANRQRYRAEPGVREQERERVRRWAEANKERHRARNAAFRARHPEQARAHDRRWYGKAGKATKRQYRAENRARFRNYYATRRARRRQLPREVVDRDALIARDKGRCYLCGCFPAAEALVLDHVVPLARGGAHTSDNLRVACQPCNLRKGTRLLTELPWYHPL